MTWLPDDEVVAWEIWCPYCGRSDDKPLSWVPSFAFTDDHTVTRPGRFYPTGRGIARQLSAIRRSLFPSSTSYSSIP